MNHHTFDVNGFCSIRSVALSKCDHILNFSIPAALSSSPSEAAHCASIPAVIAGDVEMLLAANKALPTGEWKDEIGV